MATAELTQPEETTRVVELKNIGPIAHSRIVVPESGVCVLRARNGSGKSIAIGAIENLVRGKGGAPVKDRELHGEVSGFGATLKIGKRATHSGELEVISIDGKLDAADLVDPGIAAPESADAKRIRALIALSGQTADVSLFYPLVGGKENFERLCPGIDIGVDDVLVLADRVKRKLEEWARNEESLADQETGKAKSCKDQAGTIDPAAECDADILQERLEQAIRHKSELDARANAAADSRKIASEARTKLDEARAQSASLPTVDEARESEAAALERYETAKTEVARLKAELEAAHNEAYRAQTCWDAAVGNRSSAESRAAAMDGWEAAIEASARVQSPSPEAVAGAADDVAAARQAVEQGTRIRDAKKAIEKAEQHSRDAVAHAAEGKALRDAAKGIDDVLSGLVAKGGSALRVEAGRLVTTTGRGTTYFADLSHGERWKLAIDVCVDAVGATGLLPIRQEAWEGLDNTNRRAIAQHARDRGVLVLTAEASDDQEITSEVL